MLEFADEIDGVFHLQLEPFRERPIGQPKDPPDAVEIGIDRDGEVVALVAKEREPAGMPYDQIEQIAMDDEVTLPICGNMDGVFDHFDAAEMRPVEIPEKLIVVARDVDEPRALAS